MPVVDVHLCHSSDGSDREAGRCLVGGPWWFVAGVGPGRVADLPMDGGVSRLRGVTLQDLPSPCLEPLLQGLDLIRADAVLGERGGPQGGDVAELFSEEHRVESGVVFCGEL